MKEFIEVSYLLEVEIRDSNVDIHSSLKEIKENFDRYARAIVGAEQDEWDTDNIITDVRILKQSKKQSY